jgi:hypothetical protein
MDRESDDCTAFECSRGMKCCGKPITQITGKWDPRIKALKNLQADLDEEVKISIFDHHCNTLHRKERVPKNPS